MTPLEGFCSSFRATSWAMSVLWSLTALIRLMTGLIKVSILLISDVSMYRLLVCDRFGRVMTSSSRSPITSP